MEAVPSVWLFEGLERRSVRLQDGRVVKLSVDVKDLPPGQEGFSKYHAGKDRMVVALSSATYGQLELNDGRARFTLAHEIGHVVLHCNELERLGTLPHAAGAMARAARRGHAVFRDCEWQANAFASAFLMPARGIKQMMAEGSLRYLNLGQALSSNYVVSDMAARIRADVYRKDEAKLVNETRY